MSPKRHKAAGRRTVRARRRAPARKRPSTPKRKPTPKRRPIAKRKPVPKRKPIPKRQATKMRAAPAAAAGLLEVVKVRDSYRVPRGARVSAAVNLDAAQLGEVSMFIDRTPIGTFTAPVAARDIGLADDLLGKLLIVEAIVSDVIGQTNAMRIRVTLTGGPAPKTVPASAEVEEPGGSVQFRIFVLFLE
jgi:hypothetical protein